VSYLWRVITAIIIIAVLLWFLPTTRAFIANLLFSVARHPSMGSVVGWGFEHFSPVLPLERILLTNKTIAFNHPRPTWGRHILIIPRKQIKTIFDLADDKTHLADVWQTAREVFSRERFVPKSYALLVNGGIRQDVKQVHFHLSGEQEFAPAFASVSENAPKLQTRDFDVYQLTEHPLHVVLMPRQLIPALSNWQEADIQQLSQMELPLLDLEQLYDLSSRGFSLIIQEASELERQQLVFHVTAGALKE
jgi:diadenosine tetraphosphate (Ap4A) HIT family hydrolase